METSHHPVTLIYCSFPTREAARKAARVLLDAKLVACCNILPLGESHYVWQGNDEVASEVILIAKTVHERLAAARQKLAALHPYETPAILSFNAESTEPFAQWVLAATETPTYPTEGD